MATQLIPHSQPVPPALMATTEKVRDFINGSKAESTLRAYRSDWRDFCGWCDARSLEALPARMETVMLYLTDLAETRRVSTLERRLSAISEAHQAAGLDSPARKSRVRILLAGIRRRKGTAYTSKKPALTEHVRLMVEQLPENLLGTRDRALLLLGFAGAFRRSELVGLDVRDLTVTDDGLTVLLRRSKTDQEGEGRKVGIPYGSRPDTCPVRSVRAWLEASGITEGPVFRSVNRHGQLQPRRLSDKAVALVVKRYAVAAGLDPAKVAGHSLRSGLATSAARAGVPERIIMQQTGHRSVGMVRRYIRDGSLFRENAAACVGL